MLSRPLFAVPGGLDIQECEAIMKSTLRSNIAEYLQEDLILFLKARNRNEALQSLTSALETKGKLHDHGEFYEAILEREKVVSTGIGLNVAIPHAKLEGYQEFFIAIGVQQSLPGIDWNALDGEPVRLIFMIGGPDNRQTDYLKILSLLTTAIKDSVRRKKLLQAKSPSEIIKLFKNC